MDNNQTDSGNGAPWFLWVVGLIALAWNSLGAFLWGGTSFMPDSFLEGQPAAYVDYVTGLPVWTTVTWGLGVMGGVVGAILLLMRNRLAVPVLALSFLGAVINQSGYFTNPPPQGFFNLPLVVFILGFSIFVLWFAMLMKRRGQLG